VGGELRNTELYKNNSYKLLDDNNLLKLPIDLDKLAEQLGIDVQYKLLSDDVSGRIDYHKKDDSVEIKININEFKLRQRFTLAHEIAHFIYDIDFNKEFKIEDNKLTLYRNEGIDPIEIRANKFAEKLLMPKELFIEKLIEIKNELFPGDSNRIGVPKIYRIVEGLSKKFNVSKPAIIVRLSSIGAIERNTKNSLFEYHKL